MTVTFQANYKEVLAAVTVEKIEELLEDSYELEDILEFIDEHTEYDFVAYYEEYVRAGEQIGFDAVDSYIQEQGDVCYVEGCDDKYRGCYSSKGAFAEELYDDLYNIPVELVIDWEETYESNLRYDFTACEAGYRQVYIFAD